MSAREMRMGGAGPVRRRASRSAHTEDNGHQVQSLVRAMEIMNAIGSAEDGMSLTDVAQAADLAPSTAHRLLTTLQQGRYVRFDSERRLWFTGVQAFVNGNSFANSRDIVNLARPYLRELVRQSNETANLAVEDRGEMIYLAQNQCQHMMRALAAPGARVPMYCSAAGKTLLASMSDRQLLPLLQKQTLGRMTQKTLTTLSGLRRNLRQARAVGYAVDNEEHSIGLRCVAAAIYNEISEAIGAISVSGPAARIPESRISELGELVKLKARELTSELGGQQPGR